MATILLFLLVAGSSATDVSLDVSNLRGGSNSKRGQSTGDEEEGQTQDKLISTEDLKCHTNTKSERYTLNTCNAITELTSLNAKFTQQHLCSFCTITNMHALITPQTPNEIKK